ncbi:MAG: LysM peptidoglycan-binding domain-containing protein, partial [Cyclobacteriaceae bacterium]|nr:LysM peptidoglycan-binding domain-containing protein [Cyclobacteriaceae bacterium]
IGVNGLPGIIASSTDNSYTLAKKGEIPHSKFIEYNDLSLKSPQIVPGQVYYFKRKKKKADTHYHTVENGQSLWSVSQQYGIRMDKIISKNRITSASEIKPGRVLWLRFIRPEELPIEYSKIEETSPETEKIQVADINIAESINDSENSEDLTLIKDLKEAPLYNNEEQNQKEIDAETDGSVFYSTTGKVRKLHKVVKGETFYSISTKYNIPVPALLQWNNLEISDTIYIGQELFVFLNKTTNNYLTYKVKSGDTLYKIATDHGVSVDQILKWNERIDYHLKVGEILKINQ